MGINLELPSDELDRLSTESNINVDILFDLDGINPQKKILNSPSTNKCNKENYEKNVNGNVSGDGDHVDVCTSKVIASLEPHSGLKFESKEAAYSFYREYAKSVGFGLTIKASRRSKKSGKFIDVKIACSRFGSNRESCNVNSSRLCPKTNCKASMHIKRMQDGKWVINSFLKEHNHEICPDGFYNARRRRNKQAPVSCQKKGLQLALNEGDVELMIEYFKHMQDESPNFFYAIELEKENRLKNVFWVDTKGRHDYGYFSDAVFIDLYYIRNKYKVPFVPIVGVNHHFQPILLGCALIGDDTISTLVWLLQTWVKAMGSHAPRVIITNEDKSLKEAIMQVFPIAHHCFCLWDILEKVAKTLGCILKEYEHFLAKFKKCIYQSSTEGQFEKRWLKLVNKFELRENDFIKLLYVERKKWAPSYMKNTFLAGMSTTERSGSIVSFFDQYIHMEATFKEFLEQYKAFLLERYELEAKADFDTRSRQPELRSLSSFEKQMSDIYTFDIFSKFQVEVLGVENCHLQKKCGDNENATFQVEDNEQSQEFSVSWSEAELDISCLCRSFEYNGILCRHALLILQIYGDLNIPSHYILKRWTKDAKIKEIITEKTNKSHCRLQRFNELCKHAIKLGEEGSLSRDTYDIAFQALEDALKQCAGMNNSNKNNSKPITLTIHDFIGIEENHGNCVAKASKKKRTCKRRKVHLDPEVITLEAQDSCHHMVCHVLP